MAVQVAEGLKHLVAKFETPCATCQGVIQAGQPMFPASDSVPGDARYHHLACGIESLGSYEVLLENAPVSRCALPPPCMGPGVLLGREHAHPPAVLHPWPQVCKHWERMGVCFYKERCVFRHPGECLEVLRRAAAAQCVLGGEEGGGGP